MVVTEILTIYKHQKHNKEAYGLGGKTKQCYRSRLRPKRYFEATKERRNVIDADILEFGGPGWMCRGHLAWLVSSKALAGIFREFEVEVLGEGVQGGVLSVVKQYGVWVRLRERR